jgi:hypothetical protein
MRPLTANAKYATELPASAASPGQAPACPPNLRVDATQATKPAGPQILMRYQPPALKSATENPSNFPRPDMAPLNPSWRRHTLPRNLRNSRRMRAGCPKVNKQSLISL